MLLPKLTQQTSAPDKTVWESPSAPAACSIYFTGFCVPSLPPNTIPAGAIFSSIKTLQVLWQHSNLASCRHVSQDKLRGGSFEIFQECLSCAVSQENFSHPRKLVEADVWVSWHGSAVAVEFFSWCTSRKKVESLFFLLVQGVPVHSSPRAETLKLCTRDKLYQKPPFAFHDLVVPGTRALFFVWKWCVYG